MKRLSVVALIALAGLLGTGPAWAADGHHLILSVSENNPAQMNLALNSAGNVVRYYTGKGEEITVEIVAFGPGLNMLRADKSPVKARIASFVASMPDISFKACHNTMEAMKKKEGHDIKLLPGISVVPAGVVEIMTREEQGWGYVKP